MGGFGGGRPAGGRTSIGQSGERQSAFTKLWADRLRRALERRRITGETPGKLPTTLVTELLAGRLRRASGWNDEPQGERQASKPPNDRQTAR